MKVVRFQKAGGAVSIKISIEADPGIQWKCVYTADGKQFHDRQAAVHALGMPDELELDSNSWEFRLLNQADKPQGYKCTIVWEQDRTEIDRWEVQGSLSVEKPAKLEQGHCILGGI